MKYQAGDITVDFNSKWAATKKVGEFIKEFKDEKGNNVHGLTDDQMKEAHALCLEAEKPKAEGATAAASQQSN